MSNLTHRFSKLKMIAGASALAAMMLPAATWADTVQTTTTETTTTAAPIDTSDMAPIPDANIDYSVLVNPPFTQFDLERVHAMGLPHKTIAKIWKLSELTGVDTETLINKIQSGEALPTICDDYALPHEVLDNTNEYRYKVRNLEAAYNNTGEGRAKAMVKGWSTTIGDANLASTTYSTTTTTTSSDTMGASLSSNSNDIVGTARNAGNFHMFLRAVRAAGLDNTLHGAGPYTVFAPTDMAFAKLTSDQLSALFADPVKLTEVIEFHIIPQRISSTDAMAMTNPTSSATLEGQSLTVTSSNGMVWVNGANVVTPDIQASNGVIHAIDTVLMPSNIDNSNAVAPSSTTTSTTITTVTPAAPASSSTYSPAAPTVQNNPVAPAPAPAAPDASTPPMAQSSPSTQTNPTNGQ